jgi:hypothetical protein
VQETEKLSHFDLKHFSINFRPFWKSVPLVTTAGIGAVVVTTIYVIYYCALILKGHGVPYVLDNNETFSSLTHAYNLWNFDFFRSYGLADEAASPDPAAHPFVHTHQGNFPRVFAFLLFALGARSAESQIWITTLTIGLASVLMAYGFLRRLAGSSLFATVVVILLFSDYLLFSQWQVATYRVWHGFFFFATLLCVHGLSEWKRWRWAILTFCLYSCLFYWELVFVAFTTLSAGLYTVWMYRRRPQLILVSAVVQGTGAALALAVLVTQLVLYLGWQDFLTDFRLTFLARNYALDTEDFLATLKSFYGARNIAFFYNLQSESSFIGISAFTRSLFQNVFEIATPFLTLLGFGLAASGFFGDSRHPGPRDVAVISPIVTFAATAVLVPGIFLMIWGANSGDYVIGLRSGGSSTITFLMAKTALCFVLSIGLALGLRALAARISVSGTPAAISRCLRASLFLFGFGFLIIAQAHLYNQAHAILWLETLTAAPAWAAQIIVLAVALIGALVILAGRRATLGPWHHLPSSVTPFFLCGGTAYAAVYILNPGYLHSGYLLRLCPLPVFLFDSLLALGLVTVIAVTYTLASEARRQTSRSMRRSIAFIAGFVAVSFIASWDWVQTQYLHWLPPNQLEFIRHFSSLDFKGEGIVTNSYALPFAYVANTWAYGFTSSPWVSASTPSPPYLWLADRLANPVYLRPGFYVCFMPADIDTVIAKLSNPSSPQQGCSSLKIVRRAIDGNDENDLPRAKPVAYDKQSDRWAILRLEWTSPHPADR